MQTRKCLMKGTVEIQDLTKTSVFLRILKMLQLWYILPPSHRNPCVEDLEEVLLFRKNFRAANPSWPDVIRWKLPEEFVHPSFTNVKLIETEKSCQKSFRKNQRVSVRASRRTFSACLRTSCTFFKKIILPSSRKSIFKDKNIVLQTISFNKNSSQYPQLPFCLK